MYKVQVWLEIHLKVLLGKIEGKR